MQDFKTTLTTATRSIDTFRYCRPLSVEHPLRLLSHFICRPLIYSHILFFPNNLQVEQDLKAVLVWSPLASTVLFFFCVFQFLPLLHKETKICMNAIKMHCILSKIFEDCNIYSQGDSISKFMHEYTHSKNCPKSGLSKYMSSQLYFT